ncbi:nucleoside-binding protein [Albimonas pacifica]|uniref:Nucleoside-binding protein n=2 Tax=Albimonas pacifica TaxID=1114924 RepID=A0A1I3JVB4_9RHOB|nr:nucleoside-binding protein [Albimonas pacifica]
MHAGSRRPRISRVFAPAVPSAVRAFGPAPSSPPPRAMRDAVVAGVLALTLVALAVGTEAHAEPAVIYSTGGKFDKSFNEGAWNGAKAWSEETDESFAEFQIDSAAQSEQALRNFARDGKDPIVAIGFNHAAALAKVAPEFPDAHFAIVDMVVSGGNIRSIVYREHEGGFLVGMLGAMASETGKLGFVGGMDIPLIRKFACGYIQGARAADPTVEVLVNYTGDTPAAWSDPVRGAEIARTQIEQGADVIMQAAGGTGIGVLQAAADAGVLGIGTDSNQNGLHPGRILTTMLKNVDVAVYETFKDGVAGFKAGVVSLGIAEGGIGWALDEHNRDLITPEMEQAARQAADLIADGEIKVHDSTVDGPCPVQ